MLFHVLNHCFYIFSVCCQNFLPPVVYLHPTLCHIKVSYFIQDCNKTKIAETPRAYSILGSFNVTLWIVCMEQKKKKKTPPKPKNSLFNKMPTVVEYYYIPVSRSKFSDTANIFILLMYSSNWHLTWFKRAEHHSRGDQKVRFAISDFSIPVDEHTGQRQLSHVFPKLLLSDTFFRPFGFSLPHDRGRF